MLTDNTRHAIVLLHEAGSNNASNSFNSKLNPGDRSRLSRKLIQAKLLKANGQLTRPLNQISLFDILIALDESIYPVSPSQVESRIYRFSGKGSGKLAILNRVLTELLGDIYVSDPQNMSINISKY